MYESGPVSARLSNNNLSIAGFIVLHQYFAQVDVTQDLGPAYLMGKLDGRFGLAFDSISVNHLKTPFHHLIQEGVAETMKDGWLKVTCVKN
jgi:saccharopepsin